MLNTRVVDICNIFVIIKKNILFFIIIVILLFGVLSMFITFLKNSYIYRLELSIYIKNQNKMLKLQKKLLNNNIIVHSYRKNNDIFILQKKYISKIDMEEDIDYINSIKSNDYKDIIYIDYHYISKLKFDKYRLLLLSFFFSIFIGIFIILVFDYKRALN